MGDRDRPGVFLIGYCRACVFHCSPSLCSCEGEMLQCEMLPRGQEQHPGGPPISSSVCLVMLLRIQILGNPGNVKKTMTRHLKPARLRSFREMMRDFPGCRSPAGSPHSLSRMSVGLSDLILAITFAVNVMPCFSFHFPFSPLLPVTIAHSLSQTRTLFMPAWFIFEVDTVGLM